METIEIKLEGKEYSSPEIKKDEIVGEIAQGDEISANILIAENSDVEFDAQINVIANVKKHKELLGLDYESSGHTGFASESRVSLLEQKVEETYVPKRLSLFPELSSNAERKRVTLFAEYEGESYKVSMDRLGTQIKTVTNKPSDMQVGDYIFLEKGV